MAVATIKFSREHEWIRVGDEGDDVGTVGITDYAQGQLGDVVFVELPEVGHVIARHEEAAVVESVKAASEVYAPVAGEILAVNEALVDQPGLVNSDAMGQGWFFKMRMANPADLDGLLDEPAYKAFLATLDH